MNPLQPIKIVIADDHEIFRIGFKHIIQYQYSQEIEFVAEARDGNELVESVAKHRPNVVITDIQMSSMDGIQASKIIKQQFPETSIIALSLFIDTRNIMSMIQAGVNGYLAKTSLKEEVIEAIRTVSRKESYYCSTISQKLFGTVISSYWKKKKNEKITFSEQETKVMRLICREFSIKEIASNMKLSTRTVEHYRQNIQEKIGARSVVGVALFAVVYEIVKLSEFL